MGALDSYTNLEKKFENVKTKEWDIKPQIGTNVFQINIPMQYAGPHNVVQSYLLI